MGSVGGLHKSMTRLSSSQQINAGAVITSNNRSVTAINGGSGIGIGGRHYQVSTIATSQQQCVSSGGVTVTTTASPSKSSM